MGKKNKNGDGWPDFMSGVGASILIIFLIFMVGIILYSTSTIISMREFTDVRVTNVETGERYYIYIEIDRSVYVDLLTEKPDNCRYVRTNKLKNAANNDLITPFNTFRYDGGEFYFSGSCHSLDEYTPNIAEFYQENDKKRRGLAHQKRVREYELKQQQDKGA